MSNLVMDMLVKRDMNAFWMFSTYIFENYHLWSAFWRYFFIWDCCRILWSSHSWCMIIPTNQCVASACYPQRNQCRHYWSYNSAIGCWQGHRLWCSPTYLYYPSSSGHSCTSIYKDSSLCSHRMSSSVSCLLFTTLANQIYPLLGKFEFSTSSQHYIRTKEYRTDNETFFSQNGVISLLRLYSLRGQLTIRIDLPYLHLIHSDIVGSISLVLNCVNIPLSNMYSIRMTSNLAVVNYNC